MSRKYGLILAYLFVGFATIIMILFSLLFLSSDSNIRWQSENRRLLSRVSTLEAVPVCFVFSRVGELALYNSPYESEPSRYWNPEANSFPVHKLDQTGWLQISREVYISEDDVIDTYGCLRFLKPPTPTTIPTMTPTLIPTPTTIPTRLPPMV